MKKYCGYIFYGVLILFLFGQGLGWGQVVSYPYPIPYSYLDTDTSLTANSDSKVPSQKAVKTYIGGASTTGSAASLKSPATTGVTTITGPGAGTTRNKTIRDADDTILELGGTYSPTGTWNWVTGTPSVTWPTFNQSTTGTAANLSGTPALPDGTTATTQSQADNSTKLATTAYVDTGLGGKLTTPGAWTTPAFDAANFLAIGLMTWTVEAGDVVTYAYIIEGKIMTVAFDIATSTVGGTLSDRLKITIPESKLAAKKMTTTCITSQGTPAASECYVDAGSGFIYVYLNFAHSNYANSTNLTYLKGMAIFEIQ